MKKYPVIIAALLASLVISTVHANEEAIVELNRLGCATASFACANGGGQMLSNIISLQSDTAVACAGDKTCKKACRTEKRACHKAIRVTEKSRKKNECASITDSEERKSCRVSGKDAMKQSRAQCRTEHKSCVSACSTGDQSSA